MRLLSVIASAIGLIGSVAALDASDLPPCSLNCFTAAIGETNCGFSNTVCQCTTGNQTISNVAAPCIIRNCDTSDQTKAVSVAAQICAKALATVSSTATAAQATGSNGTASVISMSTGGASCTTPMGAVALGIVGAAMLGL